MWGHPSNEHHGLSFPTGIAGCLPHSLRTVISAKKNFFFFWLLALGFWVIETERKSPSQQKKTLCDHQRPNVIQPVTWGGGTPPVLPSQSVPESSSHHSLKLRKDIWDLKDGCEIGTRAVTTCIIAPVRATATSGRYAGNKLSASPTIRPGRWLVCLLKKPLPISCRCQPLSKNPSKKE